VIRALDDAGIDVLDVEVRRPTLDDVFLTLTGRATSDELGEVTS
jgi:ABC-2 type transport system ATP-binding protein